MGTPSEQKKTLWNRLKDAASPYLLRHADDPVDWYPWGDEALEAAKRENKPILVSVGYSSCYWCHVMEREVFENPPIAELMNQYFINIKIDREERPDLDEFLMTARQLITREGGWPNNVFLTPDLKPFFAGGTFAPDDRYGKPGFPRLIEALHEAWETQREEVERSADEAMEAVTLLLGHNRHEQEEVELSPYLAAHLAQFCADYEDREAGGFYNAPKFPHERMLLCLQEIYSVTESPLIGEMVQRALDGMAAGGIQDQLRGGFHRYAVDKEWKIPHFEKMLYTQALLARCYTRWHELRGHRRHRVIAERALHSVLEKFQHAEGGFYTAWDADTDGVEGAYYVWKKEELQNVLTPAEYARFDSCYGLAEVPTFPGHPHPGGEVIYARKPLNELALQLGIPATGLWEELQRIHKKLLERRGQRKRPPLDNKIIASWNGLMIDALARGGIAFKDSIYVEAAERAGSFIWENMRDESGRLFRIHSQGKAQHKAFLEDYTFLASGFLSLHRATGRKEWLERAKELVKRTDEIFLDSSDHTYFYTDGSWQLPLRIKNAGDSALPSGMSVMLHNLLDIYEITGEQPFLKEAEKLASAYGAAMLHIPAEYAHMIHGMLRLLRHKDVNLKDMLEKIRPADSIQASAESQHVRLSAVLDRGHPFSEVQVTVSIAPGWHIAAQEGKAGPMLPASLMVRGDGVVEVVKIDWPEPKKFEAKYIERPAFVFEGEVTVPIELRLAELTEETPHKLHIILRCQPCSMDQCKAPLVLSVDV